MTLEWALVICVLAICGTFFMTKKKEDASAKFGDRVSITEKQVEKLTDQFSRTSAAVDALNADFQQIAKTAEEAKRLVSQSNLITGFIPRAQRRAQPAGPA